MQEERNNYRRQETEKVEGKIKMKKEKKIKELQTTHDRTYCYLQIYMVWPQNLWSEMYDHWEMSNTAQTSQ